MDKLDRRNSPRKKQEADIQVSIMPDFSKDNPEPSNQIPAKMVNQSSDGLCIEINRYLLPGENVRIKIAPQEDKCFEEVFYLRDGLVKWCKMIAARGPRFGAGIKTCRKVVQAPVLTSRFGRSGD
jgi:hypothetical protein